MPSALGKDKSDHVLQSPLSKDWKILRTRIPSIQLQATPRALADRYMQLYSNATDMHALLQPECEYALQFMVLLYSSFHGLGQQVLDSLCRHGVTTSSSHKLYKLQDLTLALLGTHSSTI